MEYRGSALPKERRTPPVIRPSAAAVDRHTSGLPAIAQVQIHNEGVILFLLLSLLSLLLVKMHKIQFNSIILWQPKC